MNDRTSLRFLARSGNGDLTALPIPSGVSHLSFPAGSPAHAGGPPSPVLRESAQAGAAATLEVLRGGGRPLVLLACAEAVRIRVNGMPAPRVALLGLRDEVRIGNHAPLHLSFWRDPQAGRAPEEMRPQKCPVCLTPLGSGRAYSCACGHFIHMNGEEVPAEERLECALAVPHCPVCDAEIALAAGYSYEPEA